jgi:hypothetical protein
MRENRAAFGGNAPTARARGVQQTALADRATASANWLGNRYPRAARLHYGGGLGRAGVTAPQDGGAALSTDGIGNHPPNDRALLALRRPDCPWQHDRPTSRNLDEPPVIAPMEVSCHRIQNLGSWIRRARRTSRQSTAHTVGHQSLIRPSFPLNSSVRPWGPRYSRRLSTI